MAILTGSFDDDDIGGTLQSDLILALNGNDRVIGGAGSDIIDGGAGNDVLYASTLNNIDDGAMDVLTGGDGDDIIYGTIGDSLNGNLGIDTLHLDLSSADAGVTADFRPMTLGLDIGLLDLLRIELPLFTTTLGGFEIIEELTGSAFADQFIVANVGRAGTTIDGGAGNDFLRTSGGDDMLIGGLGNDRINAGGGRDTLNGGAGKDVLIGGGGQDVLTGGGGADRFVFDDGETGRGRNSADRITDFSHAKGDKIVLGGVDAIAGTPESDAFTFIGDSRFSGTAGELRFNVIGGNTFVAADTDGDRISDFVIQLDGVVDLTAADFKL